MEKVIDVEDKIRKAEEIYYRRKNKLPPNNVYLENNKIRLNIFKKMTIQTLISATLFTSFFMVLNKDNAFSAKVKDVVNNVLTTNIDFKALYKKVVPAKENIENMPLEEKEQEPPKVQEPAEEQITPKEQKPPKAEIKEKTLSATENVAVVQEASSINDMEENANYVKKNISLIKPLNGVITSRFGSREEENLPYHNGIDIAARTGTVIISAMDGKVESASTVSGYGKYIKITKGEISTIYGHCSKLYVKKGDIIKQGQKIAEVGSTGNATGPHLHFEIRRNNRAIDPDLILKF